MEINVKMMTEEAYKTLQKNSKDAYQMVINHPSDCSWLKNYLGFEPFEVKTYVIEDFDLKLDDDYSKVALENAITLFETFKDLPRYVLCNPRFWAWVTFEKGYKAALQATKLKSAGTFSNMWIPGNSKLDNEILISKKNLILGVMSRYYFAVEMSVDEELENKYELTEYLISKPETFRTISYRSIGMVKNVSLSFIKVLRDFSKSNNCVMNNHHDRELMKEASRMGSVMLVDMMSKDEVYNYLYPKLESIHDAFTLDE
ncbi:MAG: DUF6339 family protein [Bacilli bacterium]|nr:DUF6339 family protein [Bacilli bacterium]